MTVIELRRPSYRDAERARVGAPSRPHPQRLALHDEVFEFPRPTAAARANAAQVQGTRTPAPSVRREPRANRLSTSAGRAHHAWNLMGEGATGPPRVVTSGWSSGCPATRPWFRAGPTPGEHPHPTVHPDYFTTDLRVGVPDGIELFTRPSALDPRRARGTARRAAPSIHGERPSGRSAPPCSRRSARALRRDDHRVAGTAHAQLSQRLDRCAVVAAVSGVPPLGRQEITAPAEGFERLDAQRERLAELEEEVAATAPSRPQRTYAQRVLRASAAAVISATTELDNSPGRPRVRGEYERVAEAKARRRPARGPRTGERGSRARKDGLTDSEEYKKGQDWTAARADRNRERTAAGSAPTRRPSGRRRQRRRPAAVAEQLAQQRGDTARSTRDGYRHARPRGARHLHRELVAGRWSGRRRSAPSCAARSRSRLDQLGAGVGARRAERAVERRVQAEQISTGPPPRSARPPTGSARRRRTARRR